MLFLRVNHFTIKLRAKVALIASSMRLRWWAFKNSLRDFRLALFRTLRDGQNS